jgi:hypothetical protein
VAGAQEGIARLELGLQVATGRGRAVGAISAVWRERCDGELATDRGGGLASRGYGLTVRDAVIPCFLLLYRCFCEIAEVAETWKFLFLAAG